jgi:PAS domain S-box-containing protein
MADVSSQSVRILHVDDEPDFADMAATFLENEDDRFTVETATSAAAGLERLDTTFDCVVSDYDMPGQNGIEFLEQVRAEYPDLPFILFTGKGSEAIASEAISAGVTEYLQKETGTDQYTVLANRITNVVEQFRAQEALEASQQRLSLFIEQSSLGVIEWDDDFEVVQVNAAAEEILGYTEAELLGGSWGSIVAEADQEVVDDVVTDLLDAEGGYHSINENVRKDGTRITCEWHNRIVTDDDGDASPSSRSFRTSPSAGDTNANSSWRTSASSSRSTRWARGSGSSIPRRRLSRFTRLAVPSSTWRSSQSTSSSSTSTRSIGIASHQQYARRSTPPTERVSSVARDRTSNPSGSRSRSNRSKARTGRSRASSG